MPKLRGEETNDLKNKEQSIKRQTMGPLRNQSHLRKQKHRHKWFDLKKRSKSVSFALIRRMSTLLVFKHTQ